MDSHCLANELLDLPNSKVVASVDIDTGASDSQGEEIIAKLFGYSICDVSHSQNEVVIQFEESGSGGDINVVDAVKEIQKLSSTQNFNINGLYSESSIKNYASEQGFVTSKSGTKQSGGQLLCVKELRAVKMSFLLIGSDYKRIF